MDRNHCTKHSPLDLNRIFEHNLSSFGQVLEAITSLSEDALLTFVESQRIDCLSKGLQKDSLCRKFLTELDCCVLRELNYSDILYGYALVAIWHKYI